MQTGGKVLPWWETLSIKLSDSLRHRFTQTLLLNRCLNQEKTVHGLPTMGLPRLVYIIGLMGIVYLVSQFTWWRKFTQVIVTGEFLLFFPYKIIKKFGDFTMHCWIFCLLLSNMILCFQCQFNIGSRNKDIVFTKYLVWSEPFCKGLFFFTEMLLLGENYVGFHWLHIGWWKSVHPIEYKVSNEHFILASLFNKRQRNKDKMTAMKTRNASLWLLAGKTVNSSLRDWVSKWGDMKVLSTVCNFNTFYCL